VVTAVTPRRIARRDFDPKEFLARIGQGRKIVTIPKGGTIFSQDDSCDAVFYIQAGRVKLTVVSKTGKEATIGIFGANDFFGEDSLIIRHVRMSSATALTNCTLMRIEKSAMLSTLHSQNKLSDLFVEHLLAKNIRYREDLIDQLFNSSEKRLARILLLFAGFGKDGISERTRVPKVTQGTLAEMVGTTRPRVNAFMNKFRKLGFIDYNGGLEVRSSLLNVVLQE
jgi:CRP-like cAMP-binding protein